MQVMIIDFVVSRVKTLFFQNHSMTYALNSNQKRSNKRLQEASLLEGSMLLLKSIRGISSNKSIAWLACVPLALLGLGLFNLSAHAGDFELTPQALADNLWVMVAAVLVIFMNAGFAMVEAGMCRQKNAVNILAKNLIVFTLAVTAYWFIGYNLMYASDWFIPGVLKLGGPFIDPTPTDAEALVPSIDFLFQAAFAGTAATIVSGVVAERIKFGEFIVFSLVLTALIYPIAGSWQWNFPDDAGVGGGWLARLGFIDFAGSTIVHSVGAWAGLIGAMALGPRIGKFSNGKAQALPGHNMAIATLGALILWIGWYGFNGGSVLAFNHTVPYVAVTTTLGAAGGGIAATLVSQINTGKPDLTMTINGILAGLVSVTAGCDGFSWWGAWLVGAVGGLLVVWSVAFIDGLEIDDPVGAVSVHGTCGVWGTIAVGFFNLDSGLFTGHSPEQIFIQALGALSYALFTIVTCYIAWSIIGGLFGGLRVSEEEEKIGLDVGEHGMEAYPDFSTSK
tara:strand:+ start:1747 stop:3264 length:1518 start_codon:yes stop_codon:yes gene_type:complete